jgi:hypothetical protein
MTTVREFYETIKHLEAGTLYYLARKNESTTEFVFEPLIVDPQKEDLCIKILQRTVDHPNFIAFPGTPELYNFMNEVEKL